MINAVFLDSFILKLICYQRGRIYREAIKFLHEKRDNSSKRRNVCTIFFITRRKKRGAKNVRSMFVIILAISWRTNRNNYRYPDYHIR